MTELVQPQATWKSEASPQSFWNVPQAAKTTHKLGDSHTAGARMTSVITPTIEQLYDPKEVKFLPGKGPKGKGEFVNWGTKLYELELELSYKNNEIVVLQKKLKKCTEELFPGGDTAKKSVVATLRNQCEVSKRKLENKERQLKYEQKRCRGLEHDLAQVKKENMKMRKQNLVNDKAVQTIPNNNKETQLGNAVRKPPSRTVMTQCSPTVIKVSSTTKVTSEEPPAATSPRRTVAKKKVNRRPANSIVNSKNFSSDINTSASSFGSSGSSTNIAIKSEVSSFERGAVSRRVSQNVTVENKVRVDVVPDEKRNQKSLIHSGASPSGPVETRMNSYLQPKDSPQFISSMTIRDDGERVKKTNEPLEMSITQEFNQASEQVKTIVQSNREFSMKEKPMILSPHAPTSQAPMYSHLTSLQHSTGQYYLKPGIGLNTDRDSGLSSYDTSDAGSPTNLKPCEENFHSPRPAKPSYKQILDGTAPLIPEKMQEQEVNRRIHERNIEEYIQPQYTLSSLNPSSPSHRSPSVSPTNILTSYSTPREIFERNPVTHGPGVMIPYYLFRRTDTEKKRAQEKPIFVHVSEISMRR